MDRAKRNAAMVKAWKPPIPGIREVFHARFTEHAYPPHTHDVWTLFLVDVGAIRYDLEGRPHGAEPSMVSVLPPHVVHDGRSAAVGGYRKRVLYLETSVLGEGLIGRAVDEPVLADSSLRRRLSALHDALACIDDRLEAETRFHSILESVRAALGEVPADAPPLMGQELATQLRAILDERFVEPPTMVSIATGLGVSPTRLARAFNEAFGIPPHAYVDARRIEAARDRILAGQPLVDVAAEVGFYDQAHLTRRFKRFLGTTPGRFAA